MGSADADDQRAFLTAAAGSEGMYKALIAVAAALAFLVAGMTAGTYRAEAGASASAASKYTKASTRGSPFTDYSSSSRRR
jgi:hypothetical protein